MELSITVDARIRAFPDDRSAFWRKLAAASRGTARWGQTDSNHYATSLLVELELKAFISGITFHKAKKYDEAYRIFGIDSVNVGAEQRSFLLRGSPRTALVLGGGSLNPGRAGRRGVADARRSKPGDWCGRQG